MKKLFTNNVCWYCWKHALPWIHNWVKHIKIHNDISFSIICNCQIYFAKLLFVNDLCAAHYYKLNKFIVRMQKSSELAQVFYWFVFLLLLLSVLFKCQPEITMIRTVIWWQKFYWCIRSVLVALIQLWITKFLVGIFDM